ncbi:tripartite tricarboxylate transporter substrate-binding protein [Variovorax sp. J22R133]|uniref:tripartite tricarboxylate transporter substrate-binding protein n=1 Tax=Variovorax brevis TaxID=3053503 RepID=UPI00257495F7|nr:tripartite tricarboxylate transporter substrate-binding protein [Variovorax sp. J22R133]MDM0116418.1 tripartite tricarboxylate transporter substrate-binding protein [Variovorax sp. J22R133]
MHFVRPFLTFVAAATLAIAATAQTYPAKPIKLIVPFSPGGATDIVGRIWADAASKELGQPVVVDNRAGGGGSIGSVVVAHAAADGYTLGIATVGTHAANIACNPKGGYNAVKDFTPISNLARTPNVLTVNTSVPVRGMPELLAYIKKNPGKVRYATGGTCGVHHLTGAMFTSLTGADLTHVPYRGSGLALTDVIGGHVEMFFDSLPGSLPSIQAQRLRPVAVAWETRLPSLPNVPTYAELGFKSINDAVWYGLVGPANLPPAIVSRLNEVTLKVMAMPEVRERVRLTGSEPTATTPSEFGAEIRSALERMQYTVKTQGISFDPSGS